MSTMVPRPRIRLRAWLAVGAGLLLSACASTGDPQAASGCDDRALGWAVGATFDEAAYQRLLRESGARLLNPIAASTVVRRDTRTDRLRVYLDTDNRITAARCE